MKRYVHEKKNQLETALFRAGKITRQPEIFQTILDENGNPIDTPISRKNELVGAGLQYVMGIVDYFCTHRIRDLTPTIGRAKRMQLPTMTWNMAINMATGGIEGQRKRAEAAILNLRAAQKPVFMYGMDGTQYSMIPFIIDLTYEDGEKATSASAAKLARVIKGGKQQFRVIKYIDIQFALPLYEGFFLKKTGSYSIPNGMYAQFFKSINRIKKLNPELGANDDNQYIDFYCKIARYFLLHNNLNPGEMRSCIYKSLEEIMEDCYPKMIQRREGKTFLQNEDKALSILMDALFCMHMLEGFSCYPATEGKMADGRIIFGLYRNRHDGMIAFQKFAQEGRPYN